MQHPQLPAEEFIRRFLQHVLPKGFVQVRSYGLWGANNAEKLKTARTLLENSQTPHRAKTREPEHPLSTAPSGLSLCPHCQIGHFHLIASLLPQRTRAP